jgi:N-acetylmuramoyl-L-alanine amidase
MRRPLFIFFILLTILVLPFSSIYAVKATVLPVKPIKILLVPGHDSEVWGAQYGSIKEATMTLALATQIYNILKKDKRFEVYITRDSTSSSGYTKQFSDFLAQKDAILVFEQAAKNLLQAKISSGGFVQKENAPHHTVTEDIALRLYGFNKWADENKIDAMIHIHFNDYPRANKWTIGQYKGFAIYFPDGQLANSKESGNLAADIYTQLHKKYNTSTYPPEAGGLIPDQKLIAIGSNNTLDASVRSVLVEYSYIYEKKFRTNSTRLQAYKDMASLTATGIKNYFFPK